MFRLGILNSAPMRKLLVVLLLLLSTASHAEPSAERLKLSSQLVELMNIRAASDSALQACKDPKNRVVTATSDYKANPNAFGGISPKSAYWTEVEAVYDRYDAITCASVNSEEFVAFWVKTLAEQSEADLRAAVAYWASSAGKRMQAAMLRAGEVFQQFSTEKSRMPTEAARLRFRAELTELRRKYEAHPR